MKQKDINKILNILVKDDTKVFTFDEFTAYIESIFYSIFNLIIMIHVHKFIENDIIVLNIVEPNMIDISYTYNIESKKLQILVNKIGSISIRNFNKINSLNVFIQQNIKLLLE